MGTTKLDDFSGWADDPTRPDHQQGKRPKGRESSHR